MGMNDVGAVFRYRLVADGGFLVISDRGEIQPEIIELRDNELRMGEHFRGEIVTEIFSRPGLPPEPGLFPGLMPITMFKNGVAEEQRGHNHFLINGRGISKAGNRLVQ